MQKIKITVVKPWRPHAGNVFRNPIPCRRFNREGGAWGYQIGGAQISEMHGNFIIILGSQRARCLIFNCISKTNNQG